MQGRPRRALALTAPALLAAGACSIGSGAPDTGEPSGGVGGGAGSLQAGSAGSAGAVAGAGGSTGGTAGAGGSAGSAAAAGGGATGGASGAGGAAPGGTAGGGASGLAGMSGSSGAAGAAGAPGGASGDGGAAGLAGGGGNAGTAGSAAGNAGSAGSSTGPCTKTGLSFCTDFESQTTGMPPSGMGLGTHLNGNGTVVIDATTPAHSGTKSVHVTATGYQTFFKLTGAPTFPVSGGKFYVRVYMRLGAAMTGGHNTYFEAGLDAQSDAQYETRVGVMNAMLMINQPSGDRGFLSNQNFYNDQKPGVVIAPTTWTCVESYFDTPGSTVDFWVEGVEVPDLHRTDWQQETYDALRFGYEKYAGPDADIWYDDLAVASTKIGCFP